MATISFIHLLAQPWACSLGLQPFPGILSKGRAQALMGVSSATKTPPETEPNQESPNSVQSLQKFLTDVTLDQGHKLKDADRR